MSVSGLGRKQRADIDMRAFAKSAGATVNMILLSELQVRWKPPAGEEQLWRRCGKPVS